MRLEVEGAHLHEDRWAVGDVAQELDAPGIAFDEEAIPPLGPGRSHDGAKPLRTVDRPAFLVHQLSDLLFLVEPFPHGLTHR